MDTTPAATPDTTPKEFTVAIALLEDNQGVVDEAVPEPANAVVAPTHTANVPVMVGNGLITKKAEPGSLSQAVVEFLITNVPLYVPAVAVAGILIVILPEGGKLFAAYTTSVNPFAIAAALQVILYWSGFCVVVSVSTNERVPKQTAGVDGLTETTVGRSFTVIVADPEAELEQEEALLS